MKLHISLYLYEDSRTFNGKVLLGYFSIPSHKTSFSIYTQILTPKVEDYIFFTHEKTPQNNYLGIQYSRQLFSK